MEPTNRAASATDSREKMRVVLHSFLQFLQECRICGISRSQTFLILKTNTNAFCSWFFSGVVSMRPSSTSATPEHIPSSNPWPFNRHLMPPFHLVKRMKSCWVEENKSLPPDCLDWRLLSWEQMEVMQCDFQWRHCWVYRCSPHLPKQSSSNFRPFFPVFFPLRGRVNSPK